MRGFWNFRQGSEATNIVKGDLPKDAIVIDVRTRYEFEDEHVKDALHIDLFSPDFLKKIQELNQEKPYLLYCRSGNRSEEVELIMRRMGFRNVRNIGGLYEARSLLGTVRNG